MKEAMKGLIVLMVILIVLSIALFISLIAPLRFLQIFFPD